MESWNNLLPPLLRAVLLFAVTLPVLSGQQAVSQPGRLPAPVASGSTGTTPAFVDVTLASGIRFKHNAYHTSRKYLLETMGSGVALFDYDKDGLLDIFLVNGAHLTDPSAKGTIPQKSGPEDWNRLYHQKKDGSFEDVTERAGLQGSGYGMGIAVGDYDNDGYEDLYVTAYGGNKLYHNQGDGTFVDVTEKAAVGGSGWSTSAAWVDLDNDGQLDLVVLRYLQWDFDDIWCGERRVGYRQFCHPDLFHPIAPLVFHNNGRGRFTEISAKAGLDKPGKGLGIALADYDRDGRTDIFVANDSMFEFLYHNSGDGSYQESGLLAAAAVDSNGHTYAGMGVAFQDYNNDGLPDLFVTDLANQKYALYKNDGDGSFTYATDTSAVARATLLHSGWGVHFFDDDNDGLKDVIVAQGHDIDNIELNSPQLHYREPLLLLQNDGHGSFVDVSSRAGEAFRQAWVGRGLAVGDLNNDGLEDVVVTTNDGAAFVLRNETVSANHWLTVELIGHSSNRDGIGAEVKWTAPRGSQWVTVSPAGSYLSSSDKRAHFGLGADTEGTLQIRWPSGINQLLEHVKANQFLRIEEPPQSQRPSSRFAR